MMKLKIKTRKIIELTGRLDYLKSILLKLLELIKNYGKNKINSFIGR